MNNANAHKLFLMGAIALAEVSRNGMKIDVPYCKETIKKVDKKLAHIENTIFSQDIGKIWKKKYGKETALTSTEQLADILFNELKLECVKKTATGRYCVDKEALANIKHPLCKAVLTWRKYDKVRTTYFGQIMRETNEDGFMRPFFNLHTVVTFRSSSSNPNFQNIPIRDPEMGKIIRRAFIPRKGNRIVEHDFKSLEVNIGYCHHNDPVMYKYLTDPKSDMHKDMAMECYLLKTKEVSKGTRFCGKSNFVFPEFYGSYYKQVAPNLWESIRKDKLVRVTDGVGLYEHLKEKGINNLEEYTNHIKKVEHKFWHKKFKVYTKWKEDWYESYLQKGFFDLKTGFRIHGIYKKNDVLNYPIQGSAFHCLLLTLILTNKEIKKRRMRTKIIGQIHDSIVADVPDNEFDEYRGIVTDIVENRLRKIWKWINIPLSIELEATEVDQSWYYKKEIE